MGKKKDQQLGQAVSKARERMRRKGGKKKDEFVDEYNDDNKGNLDSVTQETSLDEFLSRAQLAGTEFTAERMTMSKVVSTSESKVANNAIHDEKTRLMIKDMHSKMAHKLKIPRRPSQDQWNSVDELHKLENETFLVWRRELAELQEHDNLLLTPFERNLELWRQLWRVVERSDVVVQIVDARNPMLFRNEDMESYVKECDEQKVNLLLVNKADMLTETQRQKWADYFNKNNIRAVFWCAVPDNPDKQQSVDDLGKLDPKDDGNVDEEDDYHSVDSDDYSSEMQKKEDDGHSDDNVEDDGHSDSSEENDGPFDEQNGHLPVQLDSNEVPCSANPKSGVSSDILSCDQLIALFKSLCCKEDNSPTVIGMVGYPNVGKSSTINYLLGVKKVPVSATPGKTRHFQTLFLDNDLILCDCPGLVMPSFALSNEEMLLNGILPSDQMHDSRPAVGLLCSRVSRNALQSFYGVMLPKPGEHESPDRPPSAHELLTAIAFMRGFMSSSGIPDESRAGRMVIKDVVNGRMCWGAAPPDMDQSQYDHFIQLQHLNKGSVALEQLEKRHLLNSKPKAVDFDDSFFHKRSNTPHVKGKKMISAENDVTNSELSLTGKPWKKHQNKNKKEKLRRLYKHLDA